MASGMNAEAVLNQIVADNGDEMDDSAEYFIGTGVGRDKQDDLALDVQIDICLQTFNCLDLGSNLDAFKNIVGSFVKGSYHALKPPNDPMKVLLNTSLNCGTLFATKSKQWLQKISSRLSGKTSIGRLHVYQAEIVRSLHLETFLCRKRAVQHSRKREITDYVLYSDNEKSQLMSFSSKKAVAVFLAQLSSWSERDVQCYFKKILTGRAHGKASVIVSAVRNFSFIYKMKASQFCIFFPLWSVEHGRFSSSQLETFQILQNVLIGGNECVLSV